MCSDEDDIDDDYFVDDDFSSASCDIENKMLHK